MIVRSKSFAQNYERDSSSLIGIHPCDYCYGMDEGEGSEQNRSGAWK